MLDEKDPQAVALGYVADTAKADAKKYTKHSEDQKCNNCQLYTGKSSRQGRAVLVVRRQAGGGRRLVQRLGQEARLTSTCREPAWASSR